MAIKSLNQFRKIRLFLIAARIYWIRARHRVVFGKGTTVSLSSKFLSSTGSEIHIGSYTLIAFKTMILGKSDPSCLHPHVRIGDHCFIGGGSIIMPGVTIGSNSIVGAGSVVFDNVPPRSIVVGNPARVIRQNILVGRYGRLEGADENTRRLWNS
jgi:acetyltransferase-like isoleucine patch superfamily enzyme